MSIQGLGATPEFSREENYLVKPGDTLGSVARTLGVHPDVLAAANNLHPDGPLTPGQELIVPASPDPGRARVAMDPEPVINGPFERSEVSSFQPSGLDRLLPAEHHIDPDIAAAKLAPAFDEGIGASKLAPAFDEGIGAAKLAPAFDEGIGASKLAPAFDEGIGAAKLAPAFDEGIGAAKLAPAFDEGIGAAKLAPAFDEGIGAAKLAPAFDEGIGAAKLAPAFDEGIGASKLAPAFDEGIGARPATILGDGQVREVASRMEDPDAASELEKE